MATVICPWAAARDARAVAAPAALSERKRRRLTGIGWSMARSPFTSTNADRPRRMDGRADRVIGLCSTVAPAVSTAEGAMLKSRFIDVIYTHTEGEPTCIVHGGIV